MMASRIYLIQKYKFLCVFLVLKIFFSKISPFHRWKFCLRHHNNTLYNIFHGRCPQLKNWIKDEFFKNMKILQERHSQKYHPFEAHRHDASIDEPNICGFLHCVQNYRKKYQQNGTFWQDWSVNSSFCAQHLAPK